MDLHAYAQALANGQQMSNPQRFTHQQQQQQQQNHYLQQQQQHQPAQQPPVYQAPPPVDAVSDQP